MDNLESKIESLLFISGRPMSARELKELTRAELKDVEEACEKIMLEKKDSKGGLQILKNNLNYQLVTSPDNSELIQEFIKDETTGELSRPSLETLTIIAYRGPVSKTDLNRIRGVNCSLILNNLLVRGLIEAKEDKKKDETYYSITFDFLKYLGLNEIKELPDFERLSKDDAIDRMLEQENTSQSESVKVEDNFKDEKAEKDLGSNSSDEENCLEDEEDGEDDEEDFDDKEEDDE